MGNNSDKKLLFEAMHKVAGMPLNEDMYTDDQVTQNFDKWHNPEQGPDQDTNVEDEGMNTEEFLAAMEQFQENDRETLKNMNPEESWYNFFVQQIEGRQKVIDVAKKQAGIVNEDYYPARGGEGNSEAFKKFKYAIDLLGDNMTEDQAIQMMDEIKNELSIEEIQILMDNISGPLYTELSQYDGEMGGLNRY